MKYVALAIAALLTAGLPATAADLRVRIVDLRSTEGEVHIALYDSAARFPKPDGLKEDTVLKADGGGVTAVFRDLSPGVYAAATYHDENGNGQFDQGMLGLPLEGYAFSNDVQPILAAPDFRSASVPLPEQGTEIVIRMRY
ncbi:MAG: DUF2141 domain-containing protein [Magnetospirillum sp. WYHS-4]